jgi:hypothetical protein
VLKLSDVSRVYWDKRAASIYLYTVRQLVMGLSENATSLIDVGSAGCPYLDWYKNIPNRTSLDLRNPYASNGVNSVVGDFLAWEKDRHYDICTCLQVLEHVPPAGDFAQKLLNTCNTLIVSVPYKWTFGNNSSHVHDPVDESKMLSWFKRKPNFSIVVREVVSDSRRLIQVYECDNVDSWVSLNQRARKQKIKNG